ncbi:sulfotransferase family protein [Vallicoccus soli]|uniref:Sulfotransferase n=1 Tax=Vallicoccus soli TaxID=2339232 RepID=A0A3A3ZJV6_9ACTN|nr:sulfotransferase [Vallicoccus soli]RJK95959.1 sulfotransferase [Vallicoccus soli]
MPLPDVLIIGAPKAGSTALHAALAQHPLLFGSDPKEPKYFLCDDRPPERSGQRGPGDAHSAREWVWQRERYERLFAGAPAGALTFESTPFYLWDRRAHERIARTLPDVRLVAVVRDPLDRAFSNWTHLWVDGLEPVADFRAACELEPQRVARGWAPFWRYLELGRYGEQLAHLFTLVDPARVHVVRYRRLVDEPERTLAGVHAFLGVPPGPTTVPGSNVKRWAPDTAPRRLLRRGVRLGAAAGAYAPPRVWREVERPLLRLLQRGTAPRAVLTREDRAALLGRFTEDVHRLSDLLQEDYTDWLSPSGRGTYTVRRS